VGGMLGVEELLKELVLTPSVTGFEDEIRRILMRELRKIGANVEVDVLGNVIGCLKRGRELKVMLAAHMDQVGFMVTYVDEKGYIHFTTRGIDPRVLYGQQVIICTKGGYVPGVIAVKPVHLLKPEERGKIVEVEDMVIDIGAQSKKEAEELGIRSGVVGVVMPSYRRLAGDRAIGVGFDDKAGVAVIVHALKNLVNEGLRKTSVYIVATAQEEVGSRGAMVSAYKISPDVAIAIDVTHAVSPLVEAKRIGGIELGKGPAIGVGPNFHRGLSDLMMEICEERGIPYQVEPILGPSGTDAWVIQVVKEGVITGLTSIPLRYMHSAGEVISISDIRNTARLLSELVIKLDSSEDWRAILRS